MTEEARPDASEEKPVSSEAINAKEKEDSLKDAWENAAKEDAAKKKAEEEGFNFEDYASDYLELTAATNAPNALGNVPEINKYLPTDISVRGEEGVKPDAPDTSKENGTSKPDASDSSKENGTSKPNTSNVSKEDGTSNSITSQGSNSMPKTGVEFTGIYGVLGSIATGLVAYLRKKNK